MAVITICCRDTTCIRRRPLTVAHYISGFRLSLKPLVGSIFQCCRYIITACCLARDVSASIVIWLNIGYLNILQLISGGIFNIFSATRGLHQPQPVINHRQAPASPARALGATNKWKNKKASSAGGSSEGGRQVTAMTCAPFDGIGAVRNLSLCKIIVHRRRGRIDS